jgi:MoxR-like ATPase
VPLNVDSTLSEIGIAFDSKHVVTGKQLSEEETRRLLELIESPPVEEYYFVLRTGSDQYSDQPETRYNFKERIPGYKQLLAAAGKAKFVYIEGGSFYGKGKIGEIKPYDENGTTYFDARVLEYQEIEPKRDYASISSKLSKPFTQAGIMKISKEDYETIIGSPNADIFTMLFAELDLQLSDLHFEDLLFENDEELKSQLHAALMSGKNIMLIGPPGTGKTEIARQLGELASKKAYIDSFVLTTATSDWTTFDTIGGYGPTKDGRSLEFMPGQFLRCFKDNKVQCNKWLIIDEINRADIDKAFGQLFTVLSGQNVDLPFEIEGGNARIVTYKSLDREKLLEPCEYVLPRSWRLISTLNTYDKASLYQMSYAFMRRFAFIHVGVPSNSFIDKEWGNYLQCWNFPVEDLQQITNQIKEFWKSINTTSRPLGPAIITDMLDFLRYFDKRNSVDVKEIITIIVSAFVLPQFEGLETEELKKLQDLLANFCNVEKIQKLFSDMFK